MKNMKKYMIRCDMEGVSGIVSYEQSVPGKSEYEQGRQLFMLDLLALVKGLQDGGADEIHIYDEHYYGRNICIDQLPDGVAVYCGKPPYTAENAGGLDGTFTGLIMLGFHSKANTPNALLSHTYESDISEMILNGVSVGEIGMEAAVAGSFGVPLMLLTADSEGVKETIEISPNIRCITVKESLSENGAICYASARTQHLIYEAAKRLPNDPPSVPPYQAGLKTELEIRFYDTSYARKYLELYGNTLIRGNSAAECYAEYWKRKLEVNGKL